jgi:hypothetical protein
VVLGGAPLVLRCMLQKFGGFQVMINALLRHLFRLTKSYRQLGKVVGAFSLQDNCGVDSRSRGRLQPGATVGALQTRFRFRLPGLSLPTVAGRSLPLVN